MEQYDFFSQLNLQYKNERIINLKNLFLIFFKILIKYFENYYLVHSVEDKHMSQLTEQDYFLQ